MRESRENYVDLKGFHSVLGVKSVIDFIYTGILNISPENLLYILDASSHLQVAEVLCLCTDYLIKNLTILNCVSIHKLAQKYFLTAVISTTQQYLNDNILEIYQYGSDQFFQLTFDQLKYLLNNDCLQVFSELDLFLMIVKWIEAADSNTVQINNNATKTKLDETELENEQRFEFQEELTDKNTKNNEELRTNTRLKHAADLIKSIRFMCMAAEELADYVEPVSFMKEIPECNSYLMNAYRYHA